MQIFWQLRWFFRQEWRSYTGVILILCVVSAMQLIAPRVIGWVVDGTVNHTMPLSTLFGWLIGLVVLGLVGYLLRVIWQVWLFGTSTKLGMVLRNRLYRHYISHTAAFFDSYKRGDLMARTTNDVNAIIMASGQGVLMAVDSLISGVAVLLVMTTSLSWQLTLLALLPMPLMAFFIFRFGGQLHNQFRYSQAAFSSLTNKTQESLDGIRMVRAFGLEQRQQTEFDEVVDDTGKKIFSVACIDAKYAPVIQLTIGMSFFLSISGGAYLVSKGHLSLGDLTAFTLYQGLMIWPMLAMALLLNILERGAVAMTRLQEVLDEQPTIVSSSIELTDYRQCLDVDIKQFCWHSQAAPILENIAFKLKAGQMLGIAGAVGSGKTTLLSLLLRQIELEDGEIKYGNIAISAANLNDWRSRFAVVSQTPYLFSRTIAENIALGDPNATHEQIRHVATLACIDDDILGFPLGYETLVGEKGVTLSGGQKQRISIARALLLNAEILVLDDSLSAVDAKTEHHILLNLKTLQDKQTLIVIAHRLTALESADEIIVLQAGQLIERGSHQVLIQQSGWFSAMHRYQNLERDIEDME